MTLSPKQREIAMLDESIQDLRNQLSGLSELRQASIRKCREYIVDAIFVLEEEKLEAAMFASELIEEEHDAR